MSEELRKYLGERRPASSAPPHPGDEDARRQTEFIRPGIVGEHIKRFAPSVGSFDL